MLDIAADLKAMTLCEMDDDVSRVDAGNSEWRFEPDEDLGRRRFGIPRLDADIFCTHNRIEPGQAGETEPRPLDPKLAALAGQAGRLTDQFDLEHDALELLVDFDGLHLADIDSAIPQGVPRLDAMALLESHGNLRALRPEHRKHGNYRDHQADESHEPELGDEPGSLRFGFGLDAGDGWNRFVSRPGGRCFTHCCSSQMACGSNTMDATMLMATQSTKVMTAGPK